MEVNNSQKVQIQGGSNTNSGKPPELLVPDQEDLLQIDPASVEVFLPVLKADDLAEQVDQLKLMINKLTMEETNHQIAAIVLVQWYFNTGVKGVVRKVISNRLNSLRDVKELRDLVSEQICVHVTKMCQDSDITLEAGVVKKFLLCFDNFTCGEQGVLTASDVVTRFLVKQLECRIENICEEDVSPVDKADHIEEASDAIRTLVCMVKGALDRIVWRDEIGLLAYRILCQQDLPLDLRSNGGILFALIEKFSTSDKLENYVKEISTSSQTVDKKFTLKNPGSVLSLIHGILSTSDKEEIIAAQERGLLTNLLICYIEVAKSDKDTGTILGHSRGILSWSGKLVDFCKASKNVTFLIPLQKDLWEYVWCHLEHSIDSVKHNTKQVLSNLIVSLVAALADCGKVMLDQLLSDTIQLPLHKKARLVSLSCLVRWYSVEEVTRNYPTLQADVLSLHTEYALVGQLSDLYNNILTAHHNNSPELRPWFEASVQPLLQLYNTHHEPGVTQLVKSLLKTAVKLNSEVIELILSGDCVNNSNDKLALCCLLMSRELGQKWNFLKNSALLKRTMKHFTDEVRLQAFKLVVESRSTLEVFENAELELLLKFIQDNLAIQSPSSHQIFCTVAKKMIKRVKDGAAAINKKLTQKKYEAEYPIFKFKLESYTSFLEKLTSALFGNIFPGANFPRRAAVLELLGCIETTIGFSACSVLDLSHTINPATASSLLSYLHDSYEANQVKALRLLRALPPRTLLLHSPDHVSSMLTELTRLMVSNKPPDSVVAAAQVKLLLSAPALPWVLADRLSLVLSCPDKVKFHMAVFVRDRLVEQLSLAEQSLLDAAVDCPMYGSVSVLRSIYEEVRPTEYTEDWEQLTRDIISICYNIWRAVGCVVASDSPEGHLPMDIDDAGKKRLQRVLNRSIGSNRSNGESNSKDLSSDLYCAVFNKVVVSDVFPDEIAEEILDELVDSALGIPIKCEGNHINECEEGDVDKLGRKLEETVILEESDLSEEDLSESGLTKAREVSSQMLLLCAWRSVKEICLFLGALCKTFTSSGAVVNIVTVDQILDISSFLMDLLTETKHRGAFEQAYVAFSSLCESLWHSTLPELHSHPSQLLNLVIDSVNGSVVPAHVPSLGRTGKSSLCATRRSAGVPFIVQAIVSTELKDSPMAAQGSTFRTAMVRLLELAGDQLSEAESRVHSLNILRALYRDSRLGDAVSTYIEKGVQVAIVGFKAADWAERNAATLLFSCLVTRMFGVKREKDILSARNCLTGKVFFQRYPQLYKFFLEQFRECLQAAFTKRNPSESVLMLDCAIYPVLLVLSRIFPSPSEQQGNPYPLAAFLPFVEQCTGSAILQTRQLASTALVPLVQTDQVTEYVTTLVSKLTAQNKASQNTLHGLLLQLQEFLNRVPGLEFTLANCLLTSHLVERLVKENPCTLTCSLFTSISICLLPYSPAKPVVLELRSLLVERLLDERESSNADPTLATPEDIWKPLFFRKASEFVVLASLSEGEVGLTTKLLVHPEYEVREMVIELVTRHIETGKEPKLPCQELVSLLLCEKHPGCLQKLLTCCSKLSKDDMEEDQLQFLLSLIESTDNDSIKAAGIELCSKMTTSCQLSWCLTLKEHLEEHFSVGVRQAAAEALVTNSELFQEVPRGEAERKAWVILWSCSLKLLLDDEDSIREQVSHLVHKLTGEFVSPDLAGTLLVEHLVLKVGRTWPAACILLILGYLFTITFEEGSGDSGVSSEVDRAFDKNEMNLFQEIIPLALKVLPPLGRFVRKLSPKMLVKTFRQDWPEELNILLPELPGAVVVHNGIQLMEYLAARACVGLEEAELLVLTMMFTCIQCPTIEEQYRSFNTAMNAKADSHLTKSHFVESVLSNSIPIVKQG